MTVELVDHSGLDLLRGSASGIWRILVVLATVLLVLFIVIDVVIGAMGTWGRPEQISGGSPSAWYRILMRAAFVN